jgi:hypothetical protein
MGTTPFLLDKQPWNPDKGRLRTECEVVRAGMLSYWKVLVHRPLTNWIATRHPGLSEGSPPSSTLIRLMPHCSRGYIRWRRYDWTQTENNLRKSSFTEEVSRRYTWKTGGLEKYKKWWKARMKSASWDLVPGIDAVARAANATRFEWEDGSRPFHCRWPKFYQKVIREGLEVHFLSKKPHFKRPQATHRSPDLMNRMRDKLDKVRRRRYIAPDFVSSLTSLLLCCTERFGRHQDGL